MDQKVFTAFLNSIVKVDPSIHAGYVHNMKFGRQMFTEDREKLEVLLKTYFDKGGTQAMITVLNRNDLENAIRAMRKNTVHIGCERTRLVNALGEYLRNLEN